MLIRFKCSYVIMCHTMKTVQCNFVKYEKMTIYFHILSGFGRSEILKTGSKFFFDPVFRIIFFFNLFLFLKCVCMSARVSVS